MTFVETLLERFHAGLCQPEELRRLADTCRYHDELLVTRNPPECVRCLKARGVDGAHTHERTAEQLRRMRPNARHD